MNRTPSLFASRSVPAHLARGLFAAAFAGLAVWLLQAPDVFRDAGAIAALGGSALLLRGCPMCWITGLFETIAHSTRKEPMS